MKIYQEKETLDLYEKLLRIRIIESEISRRYKEEKMRCPVHLSVGQEAVAVGVTEAITSDDLMVSGHRAHAHYLAKGGDLNKLISEIYGKADGCSGGKGGSMHLVDKSVGFMGSTAIVGGSIPIGVGLGLANLLRKNKLVVCIFFGEAATEEGIFYESINFSVLKKLPVLFICENNNFSVYSPLSVRQPKGRKIHKLVESFGIKSSHVNGNNIYDVKKITKRIVQEIRNLQEPQFIEFSTYRILEHCGPDIDDHLNYRDPSEVESWKSKDPIKFIEENTKFITEEIKEKLTVKITNEVNSAFEFAEISPFPKKENVYKNIYSDEIKF